MNIKFLLRKRRTNPKQDEHSIKPSFRPAEPGRLMIPPLLNDAIGLVKAKLGDSPDLTIRYLDIGQSGVRAAVVYLNTLADASKIDRHIYNALRLVESEEQAEVHASLFDSLHAKLMAATHVCLTDSMEALIGALLRGNSILLLDGSVHALGIDTAGEDKRSITEPTNEKETRGPRESFIEDMKTNKMLVRRKVASENLRFFDLVLGEVTKTNVSFVYLHGIAPSSLVDDVKRRLEAIRTDGVLESAYIEEWIQEHPYSLFPQVDITERPDRAAAMLLEGRVVIIVDGTPWVLIVPTVFLQFFTTVGDYYIHFYLATALRWVRLFAFLISLTAPSLYIAITTMHQEMLPTQLALRIAGARSGVPVPAIVEALMMEIAFELLREAGVRLPKMAGQAVSIVGALIIGQAAVDAGVVSPIMVIVVALTGIASFATPSFSLAFTVRLLRFPLMILASILGLPGVTVALLVILVYMTSMKSFGVPYLSPLTPAMTAGWKDTLVRAPLRTLNRRKHRLPQNDAKQSEFESEVTEHDENEP